jgi:hypothetical protein
MRQFFAEKDGELSMKRLVGFICTVALCASLLYKPTESLIYLVGALAAASLGYTTIEKVLNKK